MMSISIGSTRPNERLQRIETRKIEDAENRWPSYYLINRCRWPPRRQPSIRKHKYAYPPNTAQIFMDGVSGLKRRTCLFDAPIKVGVTANSRNAFTR